MKNNYRIFQKFVYPGLSITIIYVGLTSLRIKYNGEEMAISKQDFERIILQ